ncbi:MAG: DUF222 domain-containing protein [Actinobacteria bacterium]|nr:DUF222 domain-containing protein [Actinomycetota bacterium]
MFERVDFVVEEMRDIAASLDPALLMGADAAALLRKVAEAERLCGAVRLLVAKRIDETGAWAGGGHRNAAEWMANETGGSVRDAIDDLQTSWNLGDQSTLGDAVRNGDLSTDKASAVSDAAKKNPDAEDELVNKAKKAPLASVRDECNKTKARAEDPEKRAERCRKARRAWFGPERDGMISLNASGPVATMAHLKAALEKRTDQIFRERNRAGAEHEQRDRYMFDALTEFLRANPTDSAGVRAGTSADAGPGTSTGGGDGVKKRATRTNVQIRVDLAALRRGRVQGDEICDAPGSGELTVAEVEALMAENDCIIDALLTRGQDVLKIVRIDRYVPVALRKSLQFMQAKCVAPGCNRTFRLERDHLEGYAESKRTSFDNLNHLCPIHHELKTRYGWVLSKNEDGEWTFEPPATATDEPRARTG